MDVALGCLEGPEIRLGGGNLATKLHPGGGFLDNDFLTMKGLDTVESLSVEASGFPKTRAFPTKCCQNISSSVEFTKTGAFANTSW
jgi:hypothetical protein